ncbi:MAG: hypothetical protein ABS35_22960 [Kaistia sp. SCN 65-12]|mgnify:CR=1 FL=1|nr:MAG: hypothetical protein ABS35_22960 [Kaistia sp. SCN 65-12]
MIERILRPTLYFTFFYNLMGFVTFLAPGRFGKLAGLPADVPFLFSGFIAFNILLFAFVGLWCARQADMNAPVLTIFGISKITFSALMGTSWLIGDTAFAGFALSLVDFAMGIIFLLGSWILSARKNPFGERI